MDWFRSIFMPPRDSVPDGNSFFIHLGPDYDDGDDDEQGDHECHSFDCDRGFPGSDSNQMFQHFDEMFRSFDEVFRNMGIADFPAFQPGIPAIEQPPPDGGGSLRDRMLKKPDSLPGDKEGYFPIEDTPRSKLPSFFGRVWTPRWGERIEEQEKLDRDLDDMVKRGNLDKIFAPYEQPSNKNRQPAIFNPQTKGYFKRISVHTFRNDNGRVEEKHTIQDGEGNERITTRRILDGQAHEIITKRDKHGEGEQTENFTNMNEDDRADFNQRWQRQAIRDPNSKLPEGAIIIRDKETASIFRNLFSMGFPGFPKSSS